MSDTDDASKSRREFLQNSVKAVTGASLPFLMGADSCEKKQECDPAISQGSSKQERTADNRAADKPLGSYDVIVIGSGFGATVAVTKLLDRKPDLKLLILERGLWWLSPDRPEPDYLKGQSRGDIQYFTRPDHSQGARYLLSILKTNTLNFPSRNSPLYYIHSFRDIDVMTAGGVGGGSLIYLNVTIPPIMDADGSYSVLRDWPIKLDKSDYDKAKKWMESWRGPLNHIVTEFPVPGLEVKDLGDKEYLYLSKTRAYRYASTVSGDAWQQKTGWMPAPLSIFEYDKDDPEINPKSNDLEICTRQGRCFLGCLPGAIQTLDKTLLKHYLGNPKYHLELHALKEVNHIAPARDGGYDVWFRGRAPDGSNKLQFYHATQVILAAGTLGSTEILLRSHCSEKTLQLSPTLGHKFSGNGDLGGFIRGAGENAKIKYKVYPTRGPLITSFTQFELKEAHPRYGNIQMTVEDGGIPPTLANFTRILLEFIEQSSGNAAANKTDNLGEFATKLCEDALKGKLPQVINPTQALNTGKLDPHDPKSFRTEHELLENTFYFQCMGKDEPNGEFFLNRKGKLDLKFSESPLTHPVYKHLEEIMCKVADNMGGTFLKFPTLYLPKPRLFTLHPLGGCSMGENSDRGVVDTKGRVFKRAADSTDLREVYEGLYVIDASIFPGPVAVNPTLTIVALALKVAEGINVGK